MCSRCFANVLNYGDDADDYWGRAQPIGDDAVQLVVQGDNVLQVVDNPPIPTVMRTPA